MTEMKIDLQAGRQASIPLLTSVESQRALIGIGGFMDNHGRMYTAPVTGGSIKFDSGSRTGEVHVFRSFRLPNPKKVKFDTARITQMDAWHQSLMSFKKRIQSAFVAIPDTVIKGRSIISIGSERLLKTLLTDWYQQAVELYNAFPRFMRLTDEAFDVAGFTETKFYETISMKLKVGVQENTFCEVLLPTDPHAGITRIVHNKSIWQWIISCLGIDQRLAAYQWLEIHWNNQSQSDLSTATILKLLGRRGSSPWITSIRMEDFAATYIFLYLFYKLTATSIKEDEWIRICKYEMYNATMADDQFIKVIETRFEQLRNGCCILRNNVTPLKQLYLLPFMLPKSQSTKKEKDAAGTCAWTISRIERVGTYSSVDIPTALITNDVPGTARVIFNKLTGQASSPVEEGVISIEMVIPAEAHITDPGKPEWRVNKEHWPITYELYDIHAFNPSQRAKLSPIMSLFYGRVPIAGDVNWPINVSLFQVNPWSERVYEEAKKEAGATGEAALKFTAGVDPAEAEEVEQPQSSLVPIKSDQPVPVPDLGVTLISDPDPGLPF